MDLTFIDNDLSESRLYRYTQSFSRLSGEDIVDLLYLQTLTICMFVQDSDQSAYASAYAAKTSQYGPYAVYRTAATDLYMLSFAVNIPEYESLGLSGSDRKFLKSVSFHNRHHYMFMQKLSKSLPSKSEMSQFLIRLESQLKISNSLYKQCRRLIIDWSSLKYSQKQYVVAKLLQSIRLKGKGSEVFNHLHAMKTTRGYKDVADKPKTSAVKRAVSTAAGAYVGSKAAPALSKGKISSTTGAGIGAIAGYWASGMKKI